MTTPIMQKKSLNAPDETRTFDKGKLDVVKLPQGVVGRATFQPGWRWSEHVKPIAGTESCQVRHFGYVESGRMRSRTDDGHEFEVGPGDVYAVPPGHDAWVVGDEPAVHVDFAGASNYAKPSGS